MVDKGSERRQLGEGIRASSERRQTPEMGESVAESADWVEAYVQRTTRVLDQRAWPKDK